MKKIIGIFGLPITCLLFYFLKAFTFVSIPCMFHKITGLYCSGCGMGRCIQSILEGKWAQAFRYNIFGFLLLPFILICLEEKCICWGIERKSDMIEHIPKNGIKVILGLFVLYGVLRNFPLCDWLAPTIIS